MTNDNDASLRALPKVGQQITVFLTPPTSRKIPKRLLLINRNRVGAVDASCFQQQMPVSLVLRLLISLCFLGGVRLVGALAVNVVLGECGAYTAIQLMNEECPKCKDNPMISVRKPGSDCSWP